MSRRFSPKALVAGKKLYELAPVFPFNRNFSPRSWWEQEVYVCLRLSGQPAAKVPSVIHEQNSLPGLTNKFLSRMVDRVMLTSRFSPFLFGTGPEQTAVTGLPVRPAIMQTKREAGLKFFGLSPEKATILGVGGSRGAKSLNEAMLAVCGRLAGDKRVQIIHLTGAAGYEEFLGGLASQGIDVSNCGNIILTHICRNGICFGLCRHLCGQGSGCFVGRMTAREFPASLIPYPCSGKPIETLMLFPFAQRGAAISLEETI